MKPSFFCAYHAKRIQSSEHNAMKFWMDVSRRGGAAYAECRIEAARTYLGAAVEIFLLRAGIKHNDYFEEGHLLQPLEFLVEVLVLDNRFDEAIMLLSTISSVINGSKQFCTARIQDQLARHYQNIEVNEKAYLTSGNLANYQFDSIGSTADITDKVH